MRFPGLDAMVHGRQRRPRTESLSSDDLVQLAVDGGPVPANVGLLLVLDARAEPDLDQLEEQLVERLLRVQRLRQRLVEPASFLRRRPYWVESAGFDPRTHITRTAGAAPGDLTALHAAAVEAVLRPLPRDRPLWRAVLVSGLQDGRLGLVLVMHHVVADGAGAMTLLAQLTDGGTTVRPTAPAASGPAPGPGPVRRDPVRSGGNRPAALRRLVVGVSRVGRGAVDLVLTAGRPAPRCSLNVPTGPRRQIQTVDVDLAEVRASGRQHGATVNDVLLVAVGAGLAAVLQQRGEHVEELVVSVPVSARTATTSNSSGNRVGVMPVRVPVHGPVEQRRAAVSLATRRAKQHGRSSASVAPVFRLLAAVGLVQWLTNRQRLVNSFLSNIHGPADPLTVAGLPVIRLVPLTSPGGNIGASFTAVSYAGTLTVTVSTDPDVVPDIAALTATVRAELEALAHA